MKKKKSNDDLLRKVELAIDAFNESNNLDEFKDFVGKISGLKPYGEEELGKAINEGNWESVRKILYGFTNFDDTPTDENKEPENPDEQQDLWDIDAKNADENLNDKTKVEAERKYLKKQIDNAHKHAKDISVGPLKKKGSMDAKRDEWKFKKELQSLSTAADDKYNESKKELAEQGKEDYEKAKQTNHSEKRIEGNMEISKKDLNKIMAAMRTINKHFAEEQVAEDQNEEVESQVEDTTDTTAEEDEGSDKTMTVVELPDDVADAIRDALDKANEVEEDDSPAEDDTEDENFSEDDTEEEDFCGDEEDFCGDGDCEEDFSDNEELYEFSEAITETIENLNKKANKLAGKLEEDSNRFVTEFSMKEFRQFAESVTETLEAISARVDALAAKTNKNEITKNLDNLKKTGDDMEEKFITKAEDKPVSAAVGAAIVQNPEASSANFSEITTTDEDEAKYKAIKEFLRG